MKGIYLTSECKAEIEAKIAEIETYEGLESGMSDNLKEILSSATILPVEESWVEVEFSLDNWFDDLVDKYPNGVIIQPKQ
jgi:hypothetical protein